MLPAASLAYRDTMPFLDYRTESWFLPQSPGVTTGPVGGLFNPGSWAMTDQAGADFWWNDRSIRQGLDNEMHVARSIGKPFGEPFLVTRTVPMVDPVSHYAPFAKIYSSRSWEEPR